jgi:predicted nucleic acid-binding protein
LRVFFDTNVLIAAFATRGLCADLLAHVLQKHELVVGEVVLEELREKLRIKIKLRKETIGEIEALLREGTVVAAWALESSSGHRPRVSDLSGQRDWWHRGARVRDR